MFLQTLIATEEEKVGEKQALYVLWPGCNSILNVREPLYRKRKAL